MTERMLLTQDNQIKDYGQTIKIMQKIKKYGRNIVRPKVILDDACEKQDPK